MDINQNLEQINTFEKGMNTDVSDTLLPNNQYRYAENLRFTSHDTDNTGELQPIKDTRLLHRMFDSQGREEQIIATSLIRDYAILITRSELGWSIWKLLNDETHLDPIRVFGPCTADLGDNISIVTRWENENDVKVYIADGVNQLMAINIMHKDGYDYAAPKDIKYLTNYSDVRLQLALTQIVETSGGLKPAVVQYTYVLYKEGGAVTRYAPFTRPIYLLNENGEGYLANEPTNKAIQITIDINDILLNGLDHILIYRITYALYGQDPEIYLIYDEKLNGNIDYTDTGVNIVSYGKNEFLKNETYDKIKPATIESKGNYLFAGNIEDFLDEIDSQWPDKLPIEIRITDETDDVYRLTYDGKFLEEKDELSYHASLMPGETYEYGIVLYDELGRRSSVRYIGEINVPEDTETIAVSPGDTKGDGWLKYTARPIGIKVTFTEPISNCSGYEIVRCLRGVNLKRTLYLGIIGLPVGHDTKLSTPAFLTRSVLHPCADKVKSNPNVAIFASPESVYLPEETKNIMSSVNTSVKGNVDYSIPLENMIYDVYDESRLNGNVYFADVHFVGITEDITMLDPKLFSGEYSVIMWDPDGENIRLSTFSCIAVGRSIKNEDGYENTRAFLKIIRPIGEGTREHYYDPNTVQNPVGEGREKIENPYYIDVDLTGPVRRDINIDGGEIKGAYIYAFNDKLSNRSIHTQPSIIFPLRHNSRPSYISKITDSKIIDSLKPGDTFLTNNTYVGFDLYLYIIGTYTYCNFVKETRLVDITGWFEYGEPQNDEGWCTAYPGGKGLLLLLGSPIPSVETSDIILGELYNYSISLNNIDELLKISIANITNESYVGYGSIEDFEFCSFGNYYEYDGNEQTVYDGDTYINVFKYNHTHAPQQSLCWLVSSPIVYMVPIQSSIDLMKTSGDLLPDINQEKDYFFQDYMGNMFGLYLQERDAYIYNAAYSQEMNLMTYHILRRTEVHSGKFDTRIKVSEEKENGEKFDSWLNFSVTGTLDADTRFGEITHMRLFKDALIFWLKEATGVVSVNERVIVLDMNDTNLLLGTGGVLQRFDYLSTKYGMLKPYIAETQSDTTLYFWDAYKKEILAYAGGLQVLPMTEIKTIRNYIINNPLNQKPLFVYDSDHNEVLMSAVNHTPIVYNETAKQFISVYTDYAAENSVYFNDRIWLTFNNNISRINAGDYVEAKLQYTVNKNSTMVKVFDNVRMGINQVSNNYFIQTPFELPVEQDVNQLLFRFKSPQQYSETQVAITDREYDYRFAIPRAQIKDGGAWNDPKYGLRMRGKYLITDLTIPEHPNTTKNAFSLQYITTKFRISYS